jgi:hypothetical protein
MNIVALLVMLLVPLPLAYGTSRLLRRKGQAGDVSDAIGSGVIFVAAILGAGIEYVEVLRDAASCGAPGVPCDNHLSPFARLAIFGGIAFVQVCTLYVISGLADERERERGVWRAR